MSEAEVLYADVTFSRSRIATETTSPSAEATYSEIKIQKKPPPPELLGSQPVESHGGSEVTSEKVALVVLAAILAVVVAALCYVTYDNMQTKSSYQGLKDEHEAVKKNLSETMSKLNQNGFVPTSCPEPDETPTDKSCWKCEKNWELHGEKCYHFSTSTSPWEEGRGLCQKEEGHLVKIDSRREQSFLERRLRDLMNEDEDKFWIGLADSQTEGEWLWVDGSPLNTSLSFWNKNEPDNWKNPEGDDEDCVRMGEKGGAADLKCWFDKSCGDPHRRICEKQAKPGSLTCV